MKYLITERQLKLIKEDNIRKINFEVFNNDWDLLQKFLERRGNPQYILIGDLDLRGLDVVTLGSLVGVEGSLHLSNNKIIENLGNLQYVRDILNLLNSSIKSLGNLQYVGRDLYLSDSEKIEDLGNLETVGGDLYLRHTPLSKTTNRKEIRDKVKVGNRIFI